MEKIKDLEVRRAVLDQLHMVMFMSINPMRPLMISRHVGGRWRWRVLITYNLVLIGQDNFGLIIANSISKGPPFQVWHVLKTFCYGCITNYMFTFHTYLNYIMG
jgi:hypothetical protein